MACGEARVQAECLQWLMNALRLPYTNARHTTTIIIAGVLLFGFLVSVFLALVVVFILSNL